MISIIDVLSIMFIIIGNDNIMAVIIVIASTINETPFLILSPSISITKYNNFIISDYII